MALVVNGGGTVLRGAAGLTTITTGQGLRVFHLSAYVRRAHGFTPAARLAAAARADRTRPRHDRAAAAARMKASTARTGG